MASGQVVTDDVVHNCVDVSHIVSLNVDALVAVYSWNFVGA